MEDKVTGFVVVWHYVANELATSMFSRKEEILLPVVLL